MNELLEILKNIEPDIDYENETNLIDGKLLDSFKIITLIGEISDHFNIDISPKWMRNEHFNSVKRMWAMIQTILEEDD